MRISDWSSDVCSSDLELEAIDGELWANVWMTDAIVRIDPETGVVGSIVDLRGLRQDAGAAGYDSVLNGIAWDAKGKRLFVTGKYWPQLYELKPADCGSGHDQIGRVLWRARVGQYGVCMRGSRSYNNTRGQHIVSQSI